MSCCSLLGRAMVLMCLWAGAWEVGVDRNTGRGPAAAHGEMGGLGIVAGSAGLGAGVVLVENMREVMVLVGEPENSWADRVKYTDGEALAMHFINVVHIYLAIVLERAHRTN